MNYRAEIDGLRAIAVVSVILYHAKIVIFGRDWFEGGFIGVDIFFVISGYLITRIILTELEQTNTFSFIKFYERRARRILPVLLVVIAVCIPFAWQKLLPLDLVEFAKSALSAIGFGSNFFFYYSTTEYGADSALLKPLLHTWSLGVEEQFYIVVPIIILVIWKFARASLLTLLIGMLIMSIQFADVMEARNSESNFFLPFSRFWELLIGSVLAFIELKYGRTKNPISTQTLPIIGLFLIIHSILFFDANTPHPSFQTLIPILGVSLVLAFCSTDEAVGKMLSLKPIVGIGLISYSLYLWHFPIFAFGRIGSPNPSNYDKIEWITSAFVMSIISYFLIEKPFRKRNLISSKNIFFTVLVALCGLFFINYKILLEDGYKNRFPGSEFKSHLLERPWEKFVDEHGWCWGRQNNFCERFVSEDKTTIISLGDSLVQSLSSNLVSKLRGEYNYVEAHASCVFLLNTKSKYCSEIYQQERAKLLDDNESVVILGGNYSGLINQVNSDGEVVDVDDLLRSLDDRSIQEEFRNTIDTILAKGHKVVLVYPIPQFKDHPVKILHNLFLNDPFETKHLLKNGYKLQRHSVFFKGSLPAFELFDSLDSPHIYRVYPHKLFCENRNSPECVVFDESNVFYYDKIHPSDDGVDMIVNLIMEQIQNAEANIRGN